MKYFNHKIILFAIIILALSLYPYLYASTRIAFSMIGSTYSNKAENLGMSDFYFFYK